MGTGLAGIEYIGPHKVSYASALSTHIEYIGLWKVDYASALSDHPDYVGSRRVSYSSALSDRLEYIGEKSPTGQAMVATVGRNLWLEQVMDRCGVQFK